MLDPTERESEALEAAARLHGEDIDAPHMLRDMARACRLEGQREIARRLTALADGVATLIEIGGRHARAHTEPERSHGA